MVRQPYSKPKPSTTHTKSVINKTYNRSGFGTYWAAGKAKAASKKKVNRGRKISIQGIPNAYAKEGKFYLRNRNAPDTLLNTRYMLIKEDKIRHAANVLNATKDLETSIINNAKDKGVLAPKDTVNKVLRGYDDATKAAAVEIIGNPANNSAILDKIHAGKAESALYKREKLYAEERKDKRSNATQRSKNFAIAAALAPLTLGISNLLNDNEE